MGTYLRVKEVLLMVIFVEEVLNLIWPRQISTYIQPNLNYFPQLNINTPLKLFSVILSFSEHQVSLFLPAQFLKYYHVSESPIKIEIGGDWTQSFRFRDGG